MTLFLAADFTLDPANAAWGKESNTFSLTVATRVVTVIPRAVVVILRTHISPYSIKNNANDIGTDALQLFHHAGHRAAVRAPRPGDNDHAIRKGRYFQRLSKSEQRRR